VPEPEASKANDAAADDRADTAAAQVLAAVAAEPRGDTESEAAAAAHTDTAAAQALAAGAPESPTPRGDTETAEPESAPDDNTGQLLVWKEVPQPVSDENPSGASYYIHISTNKTSWTRSQGVAEDVEEEDEDEDEDDATDEEEAHIEELTEERTGAQLPDGTRDSTRVVAAGASCRAAAKP